MYEQYFLADKLKPDGSGETFGGDFDAYVTQIATSATAEAEGGWFGAKEVDAFVRKGDFLCAIFSAESPTTVFNRDAAAGKRRP